MPKSTSRLSCLFLILLTLLAPGIVEAQDQVARHGMTSSDYQEQLNQWTEKGYRLKDVSGYTEHGVERYAALWEKTSGPALQTRHGMTSADYKVALDKWKGRGYRLAHVSGYSTASGQARIAAIWEKASGPPPWWYVTV